jgi:hypothetical protein
MTVTGRCRQEAHPAGHRVLAFAEVPALARPTWPAHEVPKQMHHDFRVPSIEELRVGSE